MLTEEARRHPIGRIGKPSDVTSAVAFLASDQASWITGENMVLDGGRQWTMQGLVACDHLKNPSE